MGGVPTRARWMARRVKSNFLSQRATVYSDDADGAYTVVERVAGEDDGRLRCLLDPNGAGTAPTSQARAELLSARTFFYQAGYELSNSAQVEVANVTTGAPERWNVVANTQQTEFVGAEPMYSKCDVRRAVTTN